MGYIDTADPIYISRHVFARRLLSMHQSSQQLAAVVVIIIVGPPIVFSSIIPDMRSGTALSASRRDTIHLYPVSQLAECTNGSTERFACL